MPAAPAPIVVGRGLTVTYRRGKETVVALDRVDIELGAGELVGLVGPSGSGKTTLLSVLIGWEHPQEGTLTWSAEGELTPTAPGDRSWHHLAVVPQALGLLDELNLYDNVTLPLRFCSDRGTSRIGRAGRAGHGDDGRGGEVEADRAGQRARELLEGLGVAHLGDRLPSETSLGEQQRAAVARALVQSPRLLLADEPTAHQDRDHATAVAAALRAAAEDGACCLVATHDPEVLANFDRVLTMRDGALA